MVIKPTPGSRASSKCLRRGRSKTEDVMIENLPLKAPDPLLKIIKMFREDPRTDKIDLGVGVYKDATGNTPVMRAVKDAEAVLLAGQKTKTYVGQQGDV